MGVNSLQYGRLRMISVPGAIAALIAAATASYMLLVVGQGVGSHLGRIFIFVPSFVAILAIASAAGALTSDLTRRAGVLGMAAAGLGALGCLWIWFNLFTPPTAVLLLLAAGLATIGMVGAIVPDRRQLPASISAAIGAVVALLVLGAGLSISIAPACGSAGSPFHIDKWSPPGATVYACGDGRLSVEFIRR